MRAKIKESIIAHLKKEENDGVKVGHLGARHQRNSKSYSTFNEKSIIYR